VNPIAPLRTLSPWSPAESLRALAITLLGAGAIGLGWHRVVDQPRWDDQISSVAIAGAGFVVAGFAVATWVLRGRDAIAARRRDLLPDVEASLRPTTPSAPALEPLVAHATLGPYHRAGCPMAVGRDWPAVQVGAMAGAGRRPCGVCRP
jgi:hypothetical protein